MSAAGVIVSSVKHSGGREFYIPIVIEVISLSGNICRYTKIDKLKLIVAYYNMLRFKVPVNNGSRYLCMQIDKNIA